jgi:hypothetical protein
MNAKEFKESFGAVVDNVGKVIKGKATLPR